jgi:hypothetical protein
LKSLLKTYISKMFHLQVLVLKRADHHLKRSLLLAYMTKTAIMEHPTLSLSMTTIEEDLKEMFIGLDFTTAKVL